MAYVSGSRPDTWQPWYWGDYRRDTAHLCAAQHGAYMLLIGHYWSTGKPLPDDDRMLARIACMTPAEWRRERPVIASFFQIGDGAWRHKRVGRDLEEASRRYAKRADAANKRWSKAPSQADAMHDAMHEQPQSQPHSPTGEKKTRASRASSLEGFEDWWTAYPNKVGKPAAARAWPAARRKADLEALLAGLKRYIASKPPDRPWCNPATWLNQERWLDQPAAVAANGQHVETGTLVDPEANERKQAAAIAKGIRLASVPDRRVWGWVQRGWLTAEQASAAGYAA